MRLAGLLALALARAILSPAVRLASFAARVLLAALALAALVVTCGFGLAWLLRQAVVAFTHSRPAAPRVASGEVAATSPDLL